MSDTEVPESVDPNDPAFDDPNAEPEGFPEHGEGEEGEVAD